MKKIIKHLTVAMIFICFINTVYDIYLMASIYKTKDEYEYVMNEYVIDEEQVYKISEYMYQMQALTLSQIIMEKTNNEESYEENINDLNSKIIVILDELESRLIETDESQLIHELRSNYLNYKAQQKIVIEMQTEKSFGAANYYVTNVLETRLAYINSNLEELNSTMEVKISNVKNNLSVDNKINNYTLFGFTMLSLAMLIVLIRYLLKISNSIIDSFDAEKQQHKEKLINMQSKTIEGMADLVESRDSDTGTHVVNTAYYVNEIAKSLQNDSKYKDILSDEYIELLKRFAPLHDVGKITVSDSILLKPGKLTDEEFNKMKLHTVEGGMIIDKILSETENKENVEIARDISKYHHEKWNGKGYPEGLAKDDIPLCARIMAVADVFDALISKRCYKDAFPVDDAFKIIEDESGTHFDPDVVKAFLLKKDEIKEYLNQGN